MSSRAKSRDPFLKERDSSTAVGMTIATFLKIKWLFLILFLAFLLRLYGFNWDSGYHFHPDERMLIMVADRIEFFSQMNPDFFNYGSLPVYVLSGVAQLLDFLFGTNFDNYDGLLYIGRALSTIADLVVLILVYRLSSCLFGNKAIALWSSFFYAVAFFPIQNSHFFIVDTFLNLFSLLLVYFLLQYREQRSTRLIIAIGITYAAALTTKVSAVIFLPVILFALLAPRRSTKAWRAKFPLLTTFYVLLTTAFFSFLFMPYAFFEYDRFIKDILLQIQMNSDPFIFPYTLQYVGTLPYWYYIKNIFLWGLGPVISILSVVGVVYGISYVVYCMKNGKFHLYTIYELLTTKYMLFTLFYLLYFLVIGKSAVKFMRYMLLMYPFFAILAGYGFYRIKNYDLRMKKKNSHFHISFSSLISYLLILISLLWKLPFLMIYSTPNTRIQATTWINQFIPAGSTLAVEHWDDRVPIHDPGKYRYEELPLYDIPDNDMKWRLIEAKLERSDYIIIASNRLYTPLQRLAECTDATIPRCYPQTSTYYEQLLKNERGFIKIKEFTSYPRLEVGSWKLKIVDDDADESFTVYDHPKIMIFKKI